MRRLPWILSVIVLAFLVSVSPAGERILHVYTWSDYFDSGVINDFQKKHDCQVVLDYFNSNEELLKVIEADPDAYDLLTPSSYMANILQRQGLLAPLDHSLLPNIVHLADDATSMGEDPEMAFSIPYTRTVTGIGYNKKKIPPNLIGSWSIFDHVALGGRMTLLTDMRECIGAALKLLGYSLNSTNDAEIKAAGKVIRDWNRHVEFVDAEQSKADLVEGKVVVIQNYNGDMMQAMVDNPEVGFFVPQEGSSVTTDDFVIAADTPLSDLAHAFINHMLDPEMARRNMESIFYYMPNAAALDMLAPELRDSPAFSIRNLDQKNFEVIREVGEHNRLYQEMWEALTEQER